VRAQLLPHDAVARAQVEDAERVGRDTRVAGARDHEPGELARGRAFQPPLDDLLVEAGDGVDAGVLVQAKALRATVGVPDDERLLRLVVALAALELDLVVHQMVDLVAGAVR
jgi:hypothetical protein